MFTEGGAKENGNQRKSEYGGCSGRHALIDMPTEGLGMEKKLAPIHPGEILLEDFIKPAGMTMSQLAIALQVPSNRISQICGGDRAISAETALRLARYWGTSPEFWLNLQKDYDLQIANDEYEKEINRTVQPRVSVSA
jgi:antitoxin HigA-1